MPRRQRQYVVKSDNDNRVVFTRKAVAFDARRWGISNLQAARRIAAENTDPLTSETLYEQEVYDG